MPDCVLALDQGTTSSRAILFGRDGRPIASAQEEFEQIYPQPGHVEHDPEAIWKSQLDVAKQALARGGRTAADVAAIGVTNQRETTILWEKSTGKPVANAIVWQSRVTAPICERLEGRGTGKNVPRADGTRRRRVFFRNEDRAPARHDPRTASAGRKRRDPVRHGRQLFDLATDRRKAARDRLQQRQPHADLQHSHTRLGRRAIADPEHSARPCCPRSCRRAPSTARPSRGLFGAAIPIASDIGDQQAATFGQGCFEPGSAKNTYGTGCFLLLNTGETPVASQNGLITTIGWGLGGKMTYCLEGSVFIAGAVVQWLRDGLKMIGTSSEIENLAAGGPRYGGSLSRAGVRRTGGPLLERAARGTIVGITRGTTREHIARAALESMAYQTRDVLEAMQQDSGMTLGILKVDGGATVNNLLMQFQSDVLGVNVQRPVVQETTALGAAYLAGLAVGFWKDQDDVRRNWVLDREFKPAMPRERREQLYGRWKQAVTRSLDWE